jgi:hypothetical protein
MCHHCGKGLSGKYLLSEPEAQRMAALGAVPREPPPIHTTPIGLGAGLLIIVAFLATLVGFVYAINATGGVAVVAAGAILAIFARITQAALHHREVMNALTRLVK